MPAVRLFEAMATQWRMGPAGAAGLDYAVLPWLARRLRLRCRRRDVANLRVMEAEALAVFAERREAAAKRAH